MTVTDVTRRSEGDSLMFRNDSLWSKAARLDRNISTCDPVDVASALVEHSHRHGVSDGIAIYNNGHVPTSIMMAAVCTVLKTDRHTDECMCGCNNNSNNNNNDTKACVVLPIEPQLIVNGTKEVHDKWHTYVERQL